MRRTPAAPLGAAMGDGLWTVAAYLAYVFLLPSATSWSLFALAGGTATVVEFSQLYHAPWIDVVRRTTPGGLLLGYGFDPFDLAWYWLAAAVCLAIDAASRRASRPLLPEAETAP